MAAAYRHSLRRFDEAKSLDHGDLISTAQTLAVDDLECEAAAH